MESTNINIHFQYFSKHLKRHIVLSICRHTDQRTFHFFLKITIFMPRFVFGPSTISSLSVCDSFIVCMGKTYHNIIHV